MKKSKTQKKQNKNDSNIRLLSELPFFSKKHEELTNPDNKHPERIKKQDTEIAETLDYRGINFPMKARDYKIIEGRFNINVNVFGYGNRVFPLYVSKKSNEQVLNEKKKKMKMMIHTTFLLKMLTD